MADDIVTRLRDIATYVECWTCTEYGFFKDKDPCECAGQDDLRQSAADEIERLRAERDRFEAIAEQAVKTLESAMAIIEQIQGAVHD